VFRKAISVFTICVCVMCSAASTRLLAEQELWSEFSWSTVLLTTIVLVSAWRLWWEIAELLRANTKPGADAPRSKKIHENGVMTALRQRPFASVVILLLPFLLPAVFALFAEQRLLRVFLLQELVAALVVACVWFRLAKGRALSQ